MIHLKLTAPFVTVFLIGISCTVLAQQDSSPDNIYRESALPDNGWFVNHPTEKKTTYYIANRHQGREVKLNIGRPLGLYSSSDGRETWKLLSTEFEFKGLFIHPGTGRLFAIAEYCWSADDEKTGIRQPCTADKFLMSDDGKTWRDISGKEKRFTQIVDVFPDPDNYGRICLNNSSVRPYVLQATDDNYTEWKWYRAWDWPHRHDK